MIYVGFSRGKNPLSWIIRKLTGGIVDHAFLIYRDGDQWMTFGAQFNGLHKATVKDFQKNREIVKMFQPVGFDLEGGLKAVLGEQGEKESYNFDALLGMAGVEIQKRLHERIIRNRMDFNKHRVFCSEFCEEVIYRSLLAAKIADEWFLSSDSPDTIDPEELMESMQKSSLFQEVKVLPK